jgi:hypothetical protein
MHAVCICHPLLHLTCANCDAMLLSLSQAFQHTLADQEHCIWPRAARLPKKSKSFQHMCLSALQYLYCLGSLLVLVKD